jgi:hypothetical protein
LQSDIRNNIAGWSSWQLVGLITQRSQVRVLFPLLRRSKKTSFFLCSYFCYVLVKWRYVVVQTPEYEEPTRRNAKRNANAVGNSNFLATDTRILKILLVYSWLFFILPAKLSLPQSFPKAIMANLHGKMASL